MLQLFGKTASNSQESKKEPKEIKKHYGEIEIRYKAHTNIFTSELDQFSLESVEFIEILEEIKDTNDVTVIDGFHDAISKPLIRFPNENKHAIILFICNRSDVGNLSDYVLNKRTNSYFVVKYGGNKHTLIYVDHTGDEISSTSIKYKSKKPIIYSHQCIIGCCNDVPLFYIKNKGKLKIVFNLKPEK